MHRLLQPPDELIEHYRDGVGVRFLRNDRSGDTIEVVRLCRDLAAMRAAVLDRVDRLATLRLGQFSPIRSAGAPADDSFALEIRSDHVPGVRLVEILELAGTGRLVIEVDAALHVVRQVLGALAALHESRGVAHGAIGPERLVATPRGQIMVLDHVLGLALEQLGYPPSRLWLEFRIPVPAGTGALRFDERTDVMQVGVLALALLLGRRLDAEDYPDRLAGLIDSLSWRVARDTPTPLVEAVSDWLRAVLQVGSRRRLTSARQAQVALEALLTKWRPPSHAANPLKRLLGDFQRARGAGHGRLSTSAPDGAEPAVRVPMVAAPELGAELLAGPEEPPLGPAVAPATVNPVTPVIEPADPISLRQGRGGLPERTAEAGGPAPIRPEQRRLAGVGRVARSHGRAIARASGAVLAGTGHGVVTAGRTASRAAAGAATRGTRLAGSAARAIAAGTTRAAGAIGLALATTARASGAGIARATVVTGATFTNLAHGGLRLTASVGHQVVGAVHLSGRGLAAGGAALLRAAVTVGRVSVRGAGAAVGATAHVSLMALTLTGRGAYLAGCGVVSVLVRTAPVAGRVLSAVAAAGFGAVRWCGRATVSTVAVSLHGARAIGAKSLGVAARGVDVGADVTDRLRQVRVGRPIVVSVLLLACTWPGVQLVRAWWPWVIERHLAGASDVDARAEALPVATGVGTLQVQSEPAGAEVWLNGSLQGRTPLRIPDVPAGAHTMLLRGPSGSVRTTVNVREGGTAEIVVPIYSGWIAVFAPVELQILERGVAIGSSADGRLLMAPGDHVLDLVSRRYGFSAERRATVRPGEVTALNVDMPTTALEILAPAGAEVFLDGRRLGVSPLEVQRVPIGTSVIVVRHPDLGDQRQTITLVYGPSPNRAIF